MSNPFDVGDPYIEWNEAVSAQESPEEELVMEDMHVEALETKKAEVVKILVTDYEFLTEQAEQSVFESVRFRPDLWHENAEAKDLAEMLASEDDDE